jgi:hypothetical protein
MAVRWTMSINRFALLQQASTPAGEPDSLEWLPKMLREVMTAVAAEEADTLKKAGMIARLGGLLLKASGAAELKRANKELARRCGELEARLAALEAVDEEKSVTRDSVPAVPEAADPSARGVRHPRPSAAAPRGNFSPAPEPDPPDLPALAGSAASGSARDGPAF